MALPRSRAYYLSVLPGKQWFSRASLVLLFTVGVMLLVMNRAGNPGVVALRTSIADTLTPVLTTASRPIDAIVAAGQWVSQLATLREENIALKNQNLQLRHIQAQAMEMKAENEALRALMKVVPSHHTSYVTAAVVSDMTGPYVHSLLIGGGTNHNIHKDSAVINENGLVGRVVEAGEKSARVLLLADINSRVPVMAEKSRERTILVGGSDGVPVLSYLAADSKIAVGERIVTSGDGGVFPKGLAVGKVVSVENGVVKVQPFADGNKLDYVSVVDFTL